MGSNQQDNHSQSTTTWTVPPWSGWIETTGDALLIFEAARRGLIPRVTRRLVDAERKMITSGWVFVFDEEESGIKRWTDGFFWSPSRILGNFLLYRETDKRGSGHRSSRSDASPSDEPSQYNVEGGKTESQALSRPKGEGSQSGVDRHRERTLLGSLTNSYKFKPDGLMKKTFSLTIGGVAQHLISYYRVEDVEGGRLRSPSSLPELASLDISPDYLDKTHFRNPPKVEIGLDGIPRYRGEADDADSSPSLLTAPLSSGTPLLTDGSDSTQTKRGKRYDPYGPSTGPKRTRKGKAAQGRPTSPEQFNHPSSSTQPPAHGFPDPSLPVVPHPHYPPYSLPGYYQMPAFPVPPPHPHMYPAGPYPGPSPSSNALGPHPPQPGMTTSPGQPPHYPPYLPHGVEAAGQPGQQPYYSYYHPPPGHYPGYAGWPPYAGYPPHTLPPPPATAAPAPSASDAENKDTNEQEAEASASESRSV